MNQNTSYPDKVLTALQQQRRDFQIDYLLDLLYALDGVEQSPKYHPEGDALFHSLQVFELALKQTNEPVLLLAALLHDVGKSVDSAVHDAIGADMLKGICCEQVCWLVAHHLDLLKSPAKTRRQLAGSSQLQQLALLRHWDLGGRKVDALVRSPEQALEIALGQYPFIPQSQPTRA